MRKYTYIPDNHKERIRRIKEAKITHGLTEHPVYKIWENIKKRCNNPNNPAYKNYGARGVKLYEEWANDFKSFFDYVTALKNYDEPSFTLDRVDNSGNYEPGNVRWADRHTQAVNTRLRRDNTSGYVGVQKSGYGWVAGIRVHGDWKYLGRYKTPIDGATVRDWYIIKNGLWEYPLQVIRS